jgi:beta-N-acetylhexosaminidase
VSGRRFQAFILPVFAAIVLIGGSWLLRGGNRQEPPAVSPSDEPQLTVVASLTPAPVAAGPTQGVQATPTLVPGPESTVIQPPATAPDNQVPPTAAASEVQIEAQVEAILQQMTLEQKVAQMIMVGVPGPTVDNVARRLVADIGVGGVILLERNLQSPQQLRALTAGLQDAALAGTSQLPLFIGWNHEGGDIVRAEAGVTLFPSARAVGALGDPALVFGMGQSMGVEMHNLGVNMNYAPVLDVNVDPANPVIGLRSFGEDPATVAQFGSQFIDGQQGAGVIAVAKHFPGHGRVDADSHLELPTVHASAQELWQVELPPFVATLDSVGAVMVAHLNIPALDASGRPSSLSYAVVTDLLRVRLGYEGVVMTDDMGMGAITDHYSLEEAALLAVEAGNDLLLTIEPSHPQRLVNALVGAVQSGRLDESRIDASLRRLLQLKQQYDLAPEGLPAEGPLLPQQSAHQQQALQLGAAAVHEVRDEAQWIPLPQRPQRLLLISPLSLNPGSEAGDHWSALAEQFVARGVSVTELFYDPALSGSPQLLEQRALQELSTADAAIFVLWDSALHYSQRGDTGQERLAATLLAQGRPVIMVSGHLPYDDLRLPNAPALVNLYGDSMGQLEGLVELVLGEGR